ncbi:translation initiation factor eIF-2B subunit epsilon [Sporothrix schenckii 1099-18]|uniref:Translation initiation factor eIF2B subunit epsilon n=1 Tax=Sporothrix schenckii 1099-18 TaxID=1397361 RepID=A0A0F2LT67_SPOSC|nr:translation initiation factor eIF-2B subunit epsilon [Sporothrix schenckii 1099-18]KJR80049.1 translation initiation factor eIF-2B subunit epsilon [Sporothrix schenckii 1099-18]
MSQANKKGAGARGKKTGGKGPADDKGEDVLQAVVLADSFQDRFKPLTIDRPRAFWGFSQCLLPLANTPLIEYTLEYLAMNGVQEAYVYCGAFADQVESYLAASPRWSPTSKTNPFQSLDIIRVAQASSLGDFLRDLDKRGIIAGDFVLVHGDVVSNVPLDPILARHRARREANRDAVMTLVLREGGDCDVAAGSSNDHHTRAHGIEPIFVLDATSGRCLQYDEMTPLDHGDDRYLVIDPAFLEKNADITIRSDLIDCSIDICTPDVLALWTESFDCELPRKNFLHNVLKDWELNGKLIYTEIVGDQPHPHSSASGSYAARVNSLQMYDAVSRDILSRWTYPMVPDTNLLPGHSYASVRRRAGRVGGGAGVGVSAERSVTIDPSALVSRAAVGLHTAIGANTVVSGSTIGRRCRIGNNVRLENCYLWDDVVIGDNTVVTQSILANNVQVGTDCVVPAGSILSFGVAVADKVRLTAEAGNPVVLSVSQSNGSPAVDDAAVVGAGGKGATYYHSTKDDDDDDEESDAITAESLQRSLVYSTAHLNLSTSSISSFESDGGFGDDNAVFDDDDEDAAVKGGKSGDFLSASNAGGERGSRSRLPSFASLDGSRFSTSDGLAGRFASGPGAATGLIGADGVSTVSSSFHTDAVNGLLDALRDDASGDFESARLEFMGLRLSTDASDGAVRRAVAAAFARRACELAAPVGTPGDQGRGLDASKAAERAVKSKTGAAKFVRDVGVGSGSSDEQVEFVLALQRTLVGMRIREEKENKGKHVEGLAAPGTLLAALLQQLYDSDVLDEEGILSWWADGRAAEGGSGGSGDSSMTGARERCRVLVEWLETAEEDDSDEDDEDDEDEESDEEDSD